MMRDTQPQHDEIDALWTMLTNSSGATGDLLTAVLTLTRTVNALLRHVDELQGEVGELRTQLGKRGYCSRCEASVTEADHEAGYCTQCGTSLTNRE